MTDANERRQAREQGEPISTRNSIAGVRLFLAWTAACALLGAAFAAGVQAGGVEEEDLKAAYLFNFARYVDWPEGTFDTESTSVRICVVERGSFARDAGKSIGDRKAHGRGVLFESRNSVGEYRGCHILYLSGKIDGHGGALSALSDKPIFTVSDDAGFAKVGGIANFFREGNKIRFEINPGAADAAGLKVSSRLLRIARIVE